MKIINLILKVLYIYIYKYIFFLENAITLLIYQNHWVTEIVQLKY